MNFIPLEAAPNQRLRIPLAGSRYELEIKKAAHIMCVTIIRDGLTLVEGLRCVAGSPLIPYPYLATSGNFIFLTENDELPDWRKFGSTQSLVFASAAELEALNV